MPQLFLTRLYFVSGLFLGTGIGMVVMLLITVFVKLPQN